jgi:hypothetical protein
MAAALDVEQCRSRMVPGSTDRRGTPVGVAIGHDGVEVDQRNGQITAVMVELDLPDGGSLPPPENARARL